MPPTARQHRCCQLSPAAAPPPAATARHCGLWPFHAFIWLSRLRSTDVEGAVSASERSSSISSQKNTANQPTHHITPSVAKRAEGPLPRAPAVPRLLAVGALSQLHHLPLAPVAAAGDALHHHRARRHAARHRVAPGAVLVNQVRRLQVRHLYVGLLDPLVRPAGHPAGQGRVGVLQQGLDLRAGPAGAARPKGQAVAQPRGADGLHDGGCRVRDEAAGSSGDRRSQRVCVWWPLW